MSYQQGLPGFDFHRREQSDDRYMTSDNLAYYFFNYRGRISRSEYWFANALIWCIAFVVSYFTILISRSVIDTPFYWMAGQSLITFLWQLGTGLIFLAGFTIASSLASYMLAIKRAHDRNSPGWFVLFTFVPVANLWVFIELGFLRGTDGDNLYGNDPRLRFGVPSPAGAAGAYGQAAGHPGQARHASDFPRLRTDAGRMGPAGPGNQGRPEAKGPVLVAMSGEYAGRKVPIDGHGLVIGRDPQQCNLVLASKDISRVHARVTCLVPERKFLVEDLQSRNGIFIGRERIHGTVVISSGESFTLSEDAATFMVNFS